MSTERGSRSFGAKNASNKALPRTLSNLPGLGGSPYGQKITPGTTPDTSGSFQEGTIEFFGNGSSSYSASVKEVEVEEPKPRPSVVRRSKTRVPYAKDAREVSKTERARERRLSERKASRSRSSTSSPRGAPRASRSRQSLPSPLCTQMLVSAAGLSPSPFTSPESVSTRSNSADLSISSPNYTFATVASTSITTSQGTSGIPADNGDSLLLSQAYTHSVDCGPSAYATPSHAEVDYNHQLSSIAEHLSSQTHTTPVPVPFDPYALGSPSMTLQAIQPTVQYQNAFESNQYSYTTVHGHAHNIPFGSPHIYPQTMTSAQQVHPVFEANHILSTGHTHNPGYRYVNYGVGDTQCHPQSLYPGGYPF